MIGNYVYVFEEDDVRNWRYCPVCGEEILWVIADEDEGHVSCSGHHPGEDVDFEVHDLSELDGYYEWKEYVE